MNRIVSLLFLVGCLGSGQLRRRQYDADYQQAIALCGHPDAAFQTGYNAGYGGSSMHGEWTAMCAPDAQGAAFAAYQNGFLQGANNAPIHIVHAVVPGRTTTAVSQCTFDSDCGDGFHCRDHACMGYGGIGDRCVFNSDCLDDHCFGGSCRE